jgi:hypothetical protein
MRSSNHHGKKVLADAVMSHKDKQKNANRSLLQHKCCKHHALQHTCITGDLDHQASPVSAH